jgi:catechol 2,3-dioxygenase-like lactoylglutathione lyase family enzyme
MATAKLRHIALTVPDIKREAEFFERVFGFTKNAESDRAVSLSDGVMNVTLLPYSPDRYVDKPRGTAVVGVDHIGFIIDDPKEYAAMDERIKANGGEFHAKATAGQALETKYADPHGIIFDISEPAHTWLGIKY